MVTAVTKEQFMNTSWLFQLWTLRFMSHWLQSTLCDINSAQDTCAFLLFLWEILLFKRPNINHTNERRGRFKLEFNEKQQLYFCVRGKTLNLPSVEETDVIDPLVQNSSVITAPSLQTHSFSDNCTSGSCRPLTPAVSVCFSPFCRSACVRWSLPR